MMFVAVLKKLMLELESSKRVYLAKVEEDGYDKVITINDLYDIISKIDDEEKERIMKVVKK